VTIKHYFDLRSEIVQRMFCSVPSTKPRDRRRSTHIKTPSNLFSIFSFVSVKDLFVECCSVCGLLVCLAGLSRPVSVFEQLTMADFFEMPDADEEVVNTAGETYDEPEGLPEPEPEDALAYVSS
jgi:hypothetical protein